MKKFCQGFIDPLSLFAIGFLVVSLVAGVAAISKKGISFDLRNFAMIINEGGGSATTTTPKTPTVVTVQPPAPPPAQPAKAPAQSTTNTPTSQTQTSTSDYDNCLAQNNTPSECRGLSTTTTTESPVTTTELPAPPPKVAGSPCAGGYATGSVAIGPVVNGKDSTMQCGSNGQWATCNGCLLTTIPAYLQDPDAYIEASGGYVQADEKDALKNAYKNCATPNDSATCIQSAVQKLISSREQNALTQYTQVMTACNPGVTDCATQAAAAIANSGLTTDQLSQIADEYTVNAMKDCQTSGGTWDGASCTST